ncbi:MAG: DedA family protein [Myxococcaceae bacterium]|nr:DedA family protein [Myxococcaceae bacterium]
MENLLIQIMENTGAGFSYVVVFGILLACGLGVPLPEDVSLILGGFLVYEGRAQLIPMMATGLLGILAGDSMIFFAGRRIGGKVGRSPSGFFSKVVTSEKLARVEGLFRKHGEKIVMIARFMPGVRAVTYFTAGSVKMKYSHFIFFDGIAALLSAPVFVFLGYHFGDNLHALISHIKQGQKGVFIGLGALIVVFLVYRFWKKRREAATAPAPIAPSVQAAPVEQATSSAPPADRAQ